MPRTICQIVYKFNELSDKAKERAREWYRQGNLDYDWWSAVYDDAKECLAHAGFSIDDILFTGFHSQGDGACFNGSWSASDVDAQAMRGHAPLDDTLHVIADAMEKLATRYPEASLTVRHHGHHNHEYCTRFDVELGDDTETSTELEANLIETSRKAMRWIYRQLEKEYEYRMSDEVCDDEIIANEYEFTESGNII